MDKRTLLAVVLSVVVITVGFIIQSMFFMPPPEAAQPVSQEQSQAAQQPAEAAATGGDVSASTGTAREAAPATVVATSAGAVVPYGEEPAQQIVKMETEVFDITFDTRGGKAVSIKLKEHLDKGEPLEMVQRVSEDQGAFQIHFGEAYAPAVEAGFFVHRIDGNTLEFYRDFAVNDGQGGLVPFTLKKRFTFKPKDYLFEVRILIENSVNAYPPLDFNGYAYTLSYGPQIGPEFEELDGRYEYRRYYSYANGDRKKLKLKDGEYKLDERVMWASLLGKYFAVIGIPDATEYDILFSEKPMEGLSLASRMFFSRPLIKSSRNEDVFQFYVGPKLNAQLSRYNDPEENGFGTSDLHLEEVMDTGSVLGWLEWILKKLLVFFYSIIPNWGVAIIFLTLLTKVILYPFTHKSYESTSKMQALNPKMQELREKYKNDPTKLNQEMAALYKVEGVNPLGGCLPLLLQMPVFIALYGLLNKHFDLRGAVFIPGWITDLSGPETIFTLPFDIPFLGSEIHLLPIVFALTMVISSKSMQTSSADSSQGSMKMMMYLMPVFLFFVLYSAPSGLLVYWIITNLLTMVQQKAVGKHRAKVEAREEAESGPAPGPSRGKHPQAVKSASAKKAARSAAATPAGRRKGPNVTKKKKRK